METLVSIREMELVRAAKKNIRKKATPTTVPIPMLSNILGRVIKVREGPAWRADISPPEKANTAGMIIIPPSIATPVSNSSTWVVDRSMSTSLPM